MLVCGQRNFLLQVLWFCCSFCQWFTKLGHILGMRRYADYTWWSRYLMEQIPTFGELDDKNTGPNHWKRNKFTWHMLQKCAVWNQALEYHTHLMRQCSCSILEESNPSKTNHYSVWTSEKRPVSTNASWFHSFIRTPSGYHRMEKNCLNSHCQKYFFPNPVLLLQNFQEMFSYFILRILAFVIGSCDPV